MRCIILFIFILFFCQACSFFSSEVKTVHAGQYSITANPQWKTREAGEGDQSYESPSGAIVSLNSSCAQTNQYPLDLLTRQLLLGARKIQWQKKEVKKIGEITGLLSQVIGHFESKPIYMMLFVLTVDDCVFDFTLASKKKLTDEERKDFLRYLESFTYGKS